MLVSNATLTAIQDPGTGAVGGDDYDEDAADAAAGTDPTAIGKWAGSCDAYLEQKTVAVTTQAGRSYERRWIIYLDLDVPPVLIGIGDLLTVEQVQADQSTATFTVPVLSTETRQEPDMPSDVQSRAFTVEPSSDT